MLPEKKSGEHVVAALSVRPSVSLSVRTSQICVRPITSLFEVEFRNYFTEMITIIRWRDTRNIWVASLKVKVTAWPCSRILSGGEAHNFVNWSQISKQFYIIDHHIETTCRVQHLGCYLEGQGHSMTFQQNRVRPITLLFESDFTIILHNWSPFWHDVSCATFGSLPWKSRLQHDLSAKLFPAHNCVI